MFSDETNQLIEGAFSSRETLRDARKAAAEKNAARDAAAAEAAEAAKGLATSQAELQAKTSAAIRAITDELNAKDEETATAAPRPQPQRPGISPLLAGRR